MRKKNNKTTVQTEQYTPYDVSGKISSDAFEVLGADAKVWNHWQDLLSAL